MPVFLKSTTTTQDSQSQTRNVQADRIMQYTHTVIMQCAIMSHMTTPMETANNNEAYELRVHNECVCVCNDALARSSSREISDNHRYEHCCTAIQKFNENFIRMCSARSLETQKQVGTHTRGLYTYTRQNQPQLRRVNKYVIINFTISLLQFDSTHPCAISFASSQQ